MHHGKLFLHPIDPNALPESRTALLRDLTRLGFLGPQLEGPPPTRYLIGERFLQLIIFMGCSPHIELEPPADGSTAFCHIAISDITEEIQFISGANTLLPGCPNCRSRIKDWQAMMTTWKNERLDFRWSCSDCGIQFEVEQLNWRKSAGLCRFFLEVEGIFPNEAIPIDALMNTLASATGGKWGYFYITT